MTLPALPVVMRLFPGKIARLLNLKRKAGHKRTMIAREDVEQAFRLFLNHAPRKDILPQFSSHEILFQTLLKSPEFKASARARKNHLRWPMRQVFISVPNKVIYRPIGKNACTYLKKLFVQITREDSLDLFQMDVHKLTDNLNTGLQLSDYAPTQVEAFITSPDFFKFAVFRDPAERLLSAYIEKLVAHRTELAQIRHTSSVIDSVQKAKGFDKPDYDTGITFEEFILEITSRPMHMLDPHWRPQSLYLEGITYDRIYRFDEINVLVDMLEVRSGMTLPRQAQNATKSGDGQYIENAFKLLPGQIAALPRADKKSFLTPDLNARIKTYYQQDYEFYNSL